MNKPFYLNLQFHAAEADVDSNDTSKVNFADILRKYTGEDGVIDIDKAATAVGSAVGRGFVPRSRYKAKLDEIDTLTTAKNDLEDKLAAAEKWKGKFDDEHKAFEKFKGETDAKAKRDSVVSAYRAVLKEAGIADKYLDTVIRATNFDNMKLGEDGKLEKADELKAAAEKDWADFKAKSQTKGADVETPPAGVTPGKRTKQEILEIKDTAERQKAIAENHELFGF